MNIVNMPEQEYHALPNVSASRLKKGKDSPAAMKRSFHDFSGDTEAMRIGSAIHMLVMQPERAQEELLPVDTHAIKKDISEWNKLEKATAKNEKRDPLLRPLLKLEEIFLKVKTDNPDKAVMPLKEYKLAKMIANKALARDDVRALFNKGSAEVCFVGEIDGHPAKAMMDWLRGSKKKAICIDIKTIEDQGKPFWRVIEDYGYHISQAWYEKVAEEAGIHIDEFVFVFIFKNEPYDIAVVRSTGRLAETGQNEMERLFDMYKECKANDEWPEKYPEGEVVEVDFPEYIKRGL